MKYHPAIKSVPFKYMLNEATDPPLLLLLLSRFSRVRLCATPWTAAFQAPPSMGFSRQEYWNGVPLPSPFIPSSCSVIYCMNE